MITPRVTDCHSEINIHSLLSDIDCKITNFAKRVYNKVTLMVERDINSEVIKDLLHYRRILIYKSCNDEYASCSSLEQIASRVKLLINK